MDNTYVVGIYDCSRDYVDSEIFPTLKFDGEEFDDLENTLRRNDNIFVPNYVGSYGVAPGEAM